MYTSTSSVFCAKGQALAPWPLLQEPLVCTAVPIAAERVGATRADRYGCTRKTSRKVCFVGIHARTGAPPSEEMNEMCCIMEEAGLRIERIPGGGTLFSSLIPTVELLLHL